MCVSGGLEVADEHGAALGAEVGDGFFEQGGLTAAGGAHEVEGEHGGLVHSASVIAGDGVVGL